MSSSTRSPFPRMDPYHSPGFKISPVHYMVFGSPNTSPDTHTKSSKKIDSHKEYVRKYTLKQSKKEKNAKKRDIEEVYTEGNRSKLLEQVPTYDDGDYSYCHMTLRSRFKWN